MNYERINAFLTWKRVIGVNIVIFLLLLVPFFMKFTQTTTETRSRAVVLQPTPTPYSSPNYPSEPPTLTRVIPFYGKPGDAIVLLGEHFGDKQWGSSVIIGGTVAKREDVINWTDSEITVNIPNGSIPGKIALTVNEKVTSWNGILNVSDASHAGRIEIDSRGQLLVQGVPTIDHGVIELRDANGQVQTVNVMRGIALPGEKTLLGKISSSPPLTITRVELYDDSGIFLPVFSKLSF